MEAYDKNIIKAAVQVALIFDDNADLSVKDPEVLIKKRYDAIEALKQAVNNRHSTIVSDLKLLIDLCSGKVDIEEYYGREK